MYTTKFLQQTHDSPGMLALHRGLVLFDLAVEEGKLGMEERDVVAVSIVQFVDVRSVYIVLYTQSSQVTAEGDPDTLLSFLQG